MPAASEIHDELDEATQQLHAQLIAEARNAALVQAVAGDADDPTAIDDVAHAAAGAAAPDGAGAGAGAGAAAGAGAGTVPGAARIVLVPGIFYRDYPHTGADGALLQAIAADAGMPLTIVPADGTQGLDAGAAAVCDTLLAQSGHGSIVLISLSKGSAEVRQALTHARAPQAFADVRAWVSISGLPFGTPSFENFLRNPLRRVFAHALFAVKGWRLSKVRDVLAWRPDAPFSLPSGIRFVQIAAFPAHRHLRDRRSRRMHRELAAHGPNDGFAILKDLAQLPGEFIPFYGADHYLRSVSNMADRMRRLLAVLLQPQGMT